MDLTPLQLSIAVVGGFLAGCINTLAGNGSAITLGILTEVIGLPGTSANATNRLGVLAQGGTSSWVFHRRGKLDARRDWLILASVFVGALAGVWVAARITDAQFDVVFKGLMVALLFVLLVKPKSWLREKPGQALPWFVTVPAYLLVGFYGGFIQMGMGVLFLAVLVLLSRLPMIEANAVKSFAVFLYTFAVLAFFAAKGLVHWEAALALATGQFAGGWVTAEFASRTKHAGRIAYWMLLILVVAILLRMFAFP